MMYQTPGLEKQQDGAKSRRDTKKTRRLLARSCRGIWFAVFFSRIFSAPIRVDLCHTAKAILSISIYKTWRCIHHNNIIVVIKEINCNIKENNRKGMSHKQCICPSSDITTTATTFMVHMAKETVGIAYRPMRAIHGQY